MGKYYCLIAGLPNLSLEDSKLTYSVSEFRCELDGLLTRGNKAKSRMRGDVYLAMRSKVCMTL